MLRENFADLEFFRTFIPWVSKHAMICIATFADEEEEALLSGKKLVRRYLEVALGSDSEKYIPGTLWKNEKEKKKKKGVGVVDDDGAERK